MSLPPRPALRLLALLSCLCLAAHLGAEELRIGFADGYPPYQFVDAAGKPAGLDIDLALALGRELGLEVRIVQGPWDDMVNMLRRGLGLDLVGGMEIGEERSRLFDFSRPLYSRKTVIVVPETNRDIRGLKDLNGRTITGDKDSYAEELIARNGDRNRVRIVVSSSKEEAMGLLRQGKVEACIMPRAVALYLSRKSGPAVRLVDIGDPGSPVAFAAPKGDDSLLRRLDQGLERLRARGELEAILSRWLR